jgi:hypothetical protein
MYGSCNQILFFFHGKEKFNLAILTKYKQLKFKAFASKILLYNQFLGYRTCFCLNRNQINSGI